MIRAARMGSSCEGPLYLLLAGAAGVPLTLVWDYSFESTVGVDTFFGPPHLANYAAVACAAAGAFGLARRATRGEIAGISLGPVSAPLGAWLALWGALAFAATLLFDRWWLASYGLAAGIWHPPQIAKAVSYFAVVSGAWIACLAARERVSLALVDTLACGVLLALINTVTLPWCFANRQHAGQFFALVCATYPIPLCAQALAGRARLPATAAALTYTALFALLVWGLPLVPGSPQVGPIYNPRDHLLPPPFPLALAVPALALDGLSRLQAAATSHWLQALRLGLVFFALFGAAQWMFASFLLSPAADGWLFAGGGRNFPFFLRVEPALRAGFWRDLDPELTSISALACALVAIVASSLGLWLGAGLRRVTR
jgi:hypothetical protein